MAEKKTTQEHLNVEEALTKSEAFIEKNKNLLIGVVVAIIVVIGGIVAYHNLYAKPREAKAQAALFPGQNLFELDEFEKALNGDSATTYKGFLAIEEEFSGTNAANLAKAYAGICYQHLGEYDKAVEQLNAFKGGDRMVAPSMLAAIGNCYANMGKPDQATSYLEKGALAADAASLSPIWLLQAGAIYEQQGKFAEAVRVYTLIKDKYFQSMQAVEIDKYIERAKMRQQ